MARNSNCAHVQKFICGSPFRRHESILHTGLVESDFFISAGDVAPFGGMLGWWRYRLGTPCDPPTDLARRRERGSGVALYDGKWPSLALAPFAVALPSAQNLDGSLS